MCKTLYKEQRALRTLGKVRKTDYFIFGAPLQKPIPLHYLSLTFALHLPYLHHTLTILWTIWTQSTTSEGTLYCSTHVDRCGCLEHDTTSLYTVYTPQHTKAPTDSTVQCCLRHPLVPWKRIYIHRCAKWCDDGCFVRIVFVQSFNTLHFLLWD